MSDILYQFVTLHSNLNNYPFKEIDLVVVASFLPMTCTYYKLLLHGQSIIGVTFHACFLVYKQYGPRQCACVPMVHMHTAWDSDINNRIG